MSEDELKTITEAKIRKYLDTTQRAFDKIRPVAPSPSHLKTLSDDFLLMARSYFDDAKHFTGQGDHVNAFACVNYAHAWLDAGARMGLWDVEGDDVLFTLSR